MKRQLLISVILLASLNATHAATLLEMYNTGDGVTRVWIDDRYAHFEPNSNQNPNQAEENQRGEMLIDLKTGKIYAVDHKEKLALELPTDGSHRGAAPAAAKVKVAIDKKGSGPTVAGFTTERYTMSANGTLCSEVLFSKELLGNKHLMAFFRSLSQSSSAQDGANKKSICEIADQQSDEMSTAEDFKKYGVTMRSTSVTGKVEFEIRSVKDNVTPPVNFMGLPAGYKVMTMTEMVQQMQKGAGMK